MKEKSFLVIKWITNIMLFCGILATITLPLSIKWYGSSIDSYYEEHYLIMTILFIICGVASCLIMYELRKMIKTIEIGDCFVKENVTSMKKMGIYAYIIAGVSFLRLYLYLTASVFILIIVFVLAGLLSTVLSSVFEKAVEYKLENDLTI